MSRTDSPDLGPVPPRTGSRGSQHAALTRLARRMARTGGWRHVLIVAMIAVAVAVAVGVGVTMRSSGLPVDVAVAAQFGSADLRLERSLGELRFDALPAELQRIVRELGVADGDEPRPVDVEPVVRDVIPDAEMLEGQTGYAFSAEAGQIWLSTLDPAHPLAAGLLQVSGPSPDPGQVLLSPSLLRSLDAQVGDHVELPGQGQLEVVGTARDPQHLHRPIGVLSPGADLGARGRSVWLVDIASGDDAQVAERLRTRFERRATEATPSDMEVSARSRHAALLQRGPREITETPAFVGAVVGTALLLQVAFVSAAAFATGTRRRLRDLGLLGAVGASPGHIRGVVMREAAVLGAAGALVGSVLGLVGASTLGVYLVQRVGGTLITGLQLHPADLLIPPVLGLVAALGAAYLPARTAGRVPVTTALAGRLPVSDVPRWVTPLAAASTLAGLLVLYTTRRSGAGSDEILTGLGFLAAAVGAAALGVPLLAMLGRLADRLPARPRLAVRDTVRQRTRSAAAIAALTVTLIVPVIVAVSAATDAARWSPPADLRRDVASVSGPHFRGVQLPPTDRMVEAAEDLLPPVEGRVTVTRLLSAREPGQTAIAVRPVEDPGASSIEAIHPPVGAAGTTNFGAAAVATPELLDELGLTEMRARIEDGAIVLLDMHNIRRERPVPEGPAHVVVTGPTGDRERPSRSTFPLIVERSTVATWDLPELLMSADTADRLGLVAVDSSLLLDLAEPIPQSTLRQLDRVESLSPVPFHVAGSSGAYRPSPTGTILAAVGGALVVALIISGMTAALAATESDHDLELITAVGAAPSIRRRFHGLQAGYHTLLAALLAVPTGLLIYRAAAIRTSARPWMEVPGLWLAVIVVALPVVVGGMHAVLMRSARLRAPRRIA